MSRLIERIKLRPKNNPIFLWLSISTLDPRSQWNITFKSERNIFSQEFYILRNYQSGDHNKVIFGHALLGSYLTIQKQEEGENSKMLWASQKECIQGNKKGKLPGDVSVGYLRRMEGRREKRMSSGRFLGNNGFTIIKSTINSKENIWEYGKIEHKNSFWNSQTRKLYKKV